MPKAAYRRENRFLRDTARLISDARDADVMLQTLDGLSERFVGRLPERSFRELRDRLAEEADRSQGQSRASTADDVVDALEAATARVRDWPVDRCGKNALNAGAMRAYDRGRVAYATVVRGDSSVERLHEWRKRVKDLWYHQRLLRDAWPAVLKAHAAAAHRLADVLGDDHDLAVLAETLVASPGSPSRCARPRDRRARGHRRAARPAAGGGARPRSACLRGETQGLRPPPSDLPGDRSP